MKILFLSHKFYPDIGGIETISEVLAHAFTAAGHEVHLVTWSTDKESKSFPFLVVRNPSILKLFKEHFWADLVFENNLCLRLAWPGIFFKRPSVIGLQTWVSRINGKTGLQDLLKMRWLKRARKVIACSNAIRNECWPKSIVIGNPYQEDTFKRMPFITKNIDFVFLGRLVSDKGADLAILAFHQIFKERTEKYKNGSDLLLTIIGEGPEKETLQDLVIKLGLKNNVTFKGALRGELLVECLNKHKFLLVPSFWKEPFGIVALEGMACGCIPIVSDGGGLPDAVGHAGLSFQRGNVNDLVKCINSIYGNPEMEQQYRNAAASHLKAHYPEFISKQYLKIIEDVITVD